VTPGRLRPRPRVLIVGAGVAGLEALLALRALVGALVEITIVSPETKFVNASMAVNEPSKPRRRHGLPLKDAASDLSARWHRGSAQRVDTERRKVVTNDGTELAYDKLILAVGARFAHRTQARGVLTYHGRGDGPAYRLLLRQLREGRVKKLAFVRPPGASWPLPLYDLALMTAAECKRHTRQVELSLITPEAEPLEMFGTSASGAVRGLLEDSGVALHTSSHGIPSRPGRLHVSPGDRRLEVDRIVTLPRLVGPRLCGVPHRADGFIDTDAYGRVVGLEDVFAAGDATTFPIKQGGLAAQQADAVAEAIAASVDDAIDPQPLRPVLRGLLLTGGAARYLRADVGASSSESSVSELALWWPPNRLCGRYLAPYLSRQVGFAADVMPRGEPSIVVETALDAGVPGGVPALAELRDLPGDVSGVDDEDRDLRRLKDTVADAPEQ
jgi:sulfide:quinone oxidoreductase